MIARRAVLYLTVACLAACAGERHPPQPVARRADEPTPESLLPSAGACVARYKLDYHDDPMFENVETFKAVPFDGPVGPVAPELERYSMNGHPLIRWAHQSSLGVVDRAHFSDLRIFPGATSDTKALNLIGHVSQGAFQALGGRALFELLLGARVINVYGHFTAEFCLIREAIDGDYRADFQGYLELTTYDTRFIPLKFTFRVSTDGAMHCWES